MKNKQNETPASDGASCPDFEEWWQRNGLRAEPPVLEMAYKEIAYSGWVAAVSNARNPLTKMALAQHTDSGSDDSTYSALRGRMLYDADCKNRPTYHDGKPRDTWDQLGEVEQWSWNRPAVMLKEGEDMGNLRPNLQSLCDDGTWKESEVKNGKMTKFLVGRYRVILPNVNMEAPNA